MLKVVLIDDEEIALDVLEILLQEVGGVSVQAKFLQVEEALTYLSRTETDLIFLDIEMPGMNGLDAAQRLMDDCPNTPVIFVTAYQEYAVDSFEVNAFGYLLKPVSKEKLAKTLERCRQRLGKSEFRPDRHAVQAEPEPPAIYLNVLGSMELYSQGRSLVKWRTKKAKELFVYLWQHDGTPLQRDRILDDLWPELSFDKAQMLFHTTLYHLRNTLKNIGLPGSVMFGDEKYWMHTERIASDAEQLLQWISSPTAAPDSIREMIKLYRGDYLEAEYYVWAEERRNELRGAYLQVLKQLAAQVESLERIAILRKMVALEPYTEAYYRMLMQELKETGDTAAVKTLKELMVKRFEVDLGLDLQIE